VKYDPDIAPDLARWPDSDEEARVHAIREYHKRAKQPVGQNPSLHAAIRTVVVEYQLPKGTRPPPPPRHGSFQKVQIDTTRSTQLAQSWLL
jgi:hypothetical protein